MKKMTEISIAKAIEELKTAYLSVPRPDSACDKLLHCINELEELLLQDEWEREEGQE
jgi:hypothetical protein